MEDILMSGATGILKKLVGVVSEDIGSALGVKDDLKKLQSTLEMILAVIADAEKRQGKEELVRLWLRRLKDIAYDADDVIDEFSYENMRRCEKKDNSKQKVFNLTTSSSKLPLAFRLKMGKKIKEINKKLDEITKDMGRFQLEFTTPIPDGESTDQLDRQDTSHVNESEIVGREDDESRITKLLITHTTSSSSSSSTSSFTNPNQYPEHISVISIVGMGGLGKTTLAQLAYKNELVNKVFKLAMWVHVSEIFDIEIILVNIMESITKTKFHKPSNFHVLVNIVQKQLNGKRYLLVLDDLWNEDSEQWSSLMSVLLVGAPGSKILITTRNDQVASVVRGSIPPYNLKQLEDDECWSIIQTKAFSPGGALDAPKMTDIGKEIAKKCCGLPLAAKFLGGLMRLNNKESDWISIKDDDTWNTSDSKRKILPVLKLSYNYLPSHLKQCFSYCSIFPKNWEISKETLVHLWMAEGFLKESGTRNKRSIEDHGRDYFESLARSSFFHNFKKNAVDDIKTCKMHDLVHDLAQDVFGENEMLSLKASKSADVSKVFRLRLDLDEEISTTFLKSLSYAKKLRTLFIPEGSKLDPSIFSENKRLRILHVGRSPDHTYPGPKWRPLSVLKHLRYLRLTSLDLSELETDKSINKLYNLESLVLNDMGIGVQILLTNIQSLEKLRYLEVSDTDMVELPDSVTSLYNLQTLDLNNCALKFIPDSISGLKNLRFLNLSSNPIEELPVSVITLTNLEALNVSFCKNLKALPEYVSGLKNLRGFDFRMCPLLEALPEDFGNLSQLRYLNLNGTHINVLPESCANLNNLEFIDLYQCELPRNVKHLTKLRKFMHDWCDPPAVLGLGKLVCLQKLVYSVPETPISEPECNVGIEELGNLNFLEMLRIGNLQNVKDPIAADRADLKGKQNLLRLFLNFGEKRKKMKINLGNHLPVFEALKPPTSLRSLHIEYFMGCDLPAWMCVPNGLENLVELKLINCKGIKQLPASIGKLPCLGHLDLTGMSSLKSLDISGFATLIDLLLTDMFRLEELSYSYPCLQYLKIRGCKRLTEIPSFPSLWYLELEKVDHKLICSVGRSQTTLTDLCIQNGEDLIYFPISILQNNCKLQSLGIKECNQLEGFCVSDDDNGENMVALCGPELYSGSLQKLGLFNCPLLKFLPNLRGWTSLQELNILDCPQVKESLNYDLKSLSFLQELAVDFI
ncbi:putative disease resistance protein RGA3 [Papaver somniferum]|uniref:putative disease resistance protein RGA3 n=1 Tax=Papaver somniferum TaxID=3469 RepID=UPI000E7021E9|nr:putative disease resistance protein RGA3 [Papaver somniferum]